MFEFFFTYSRRRHLLARNLPKMAIKQVRKFSSKYAKIQSFFGFDKSVVTNVIEEKKRKMPECARPTVFDSLMALVRWDKAKYLHEIVDEKHKKMGPIFKEHIGPITAIFINSPEDYRKVFRLEGPTPRHFLPQAWTIYNDLRQCQRGLLFMDGEEWLHFRRIMNRLMLSPNLASEIITRSCEEAAEALTDEWKKDLQENPVLVGLEKRLYKWSIEVMMATLVGSSWQHYSQTQGQGHAKKLAEILHRIFLLSARLSVLPTKLVVKFRLPVWRQFTQVADEALETVHKIVPEMVRLQGDGLLALMQAQDVKERDLSRIVADLIIAAGDTTTYSTQWALFLLATHPHVQNELLNRLDGLSSEEIMREPFLRGVMKESLRLYPTAPFLTRMLPEDSEIGGYPVSRGELILMSLYSSGRDEQNFPRAQEFLPERWIRNEQNCYDAVANPYASIPFALGARSCIGRRLAETQMLLTLAQLVKTFQLSCTNRNAIKMILHLIAVPSESVELKLTPRKKTGYV